MNPACSRRVTLSCIAPRCAKGATSSARKSLLATPATRRTLQIGPRQLLPTGHRSHRTNNTLIQSSVTGAATAAAAAAALPRQGVATAGAAAVATPETANDSPPDWCGLDVAVVGGGPAGLSVALALLQVQPDLKIKVFEASPAYTQQGAGVFFLVNGARALQAIYPAVLIRLLRDAAFMSASYQYNDETGERMPWQTAFSPLETLERDGFPLGTMLPWNSLRTALFEALPPGIVEFGCKVVGCQEPEAQLEGSNSTSSSSSSSGPSPSWYTLDVLRAEGAAADPPGQSEAGRGGGGGVGEAPPQRLATARARFVIAADGYFSRVRRTAGDRQAPAFRGSVRWLGNITQAELESGRVPLPAALDTRRDPQALTHVHSWTTVAADRPLAGPPRRALVVHPVGCGGGDSSGQGRLVWNLFSSVELLEAGGVSFPPPAAVVASMATTAGAGQAQVKGEPPEVDAAGAGRDGVGVVGQQAGGSGVGARDGDGDDGAQSDSVQVTTRRGARSLQRALVGGRHLPPELLALLAATPPERVMEFGLYTHGPDTYQKGAWARGGLLVVGDAAHVVGPDGQGASQAFEDAAVLGAIVRQHGLGPETFAAWEEARQPRVRGIQSDSSPEGSVRRGLIFGASFEPLWSPLALAPSLPGGVAAEVRQAVERGGQEAGRQVVTAWCQREMRRIVELQVAGRPAVETVPPPAGAYRVR